MFQSIQCFAGQVNKWKITDDDFTENVVIDFKCNEISNNGCIRAAFATIKCYEEMNLPVSKNLILLFLHYDKLKFGWTMKKQIYWQDKYNSKNFSKYKEDVEKYLILL
jgi:hypothetical protein